MSSGVNKVIIVGYLGKDPEIRTTAGGKSVGTLSVAVSDGYGEKEHTEWFSVTVWEKTADACGKYLAKGSQVYVEGRLRTETYEKEGQKRYITKLAAEVVRFLGKPGQKRQEDAPSSASPFGADEQPF